MLIVQIISIIAIIIFIFLIVLFISDIFKNKKHDTIYYILYVKEEGIYGIYTTLQGARRGKEHLAHRFTAEALAVDPLESGLSRADEESIYEQMSSLIYFIPFTSPFNTLMWKGIK